VGANRALAYGWVVAQLVATTLDLHTTFANVSNTGTISTMLLNTVP
jgi:hypothetical protein